MGELQSIGYNGQPVQQAFRRVDPPVAVLVDLQERPYAEAARIAGVELNTLRSRLHRGRARLLAALQDDCRPGADTAAFDRSSKSA